jgi:uncharacterized caspase-like protein
VVFEYATSYGHSWAVVIGIDRYLAMPPLNYAVADAQSIAETLVSAHDFDADKVFLLRNSEATQNNIRTLLDEKLTDASLVQPDDRVLFFFAGHGVTRHGSRGDVGYLAPVDARRGQWRSFMPIEQITRAAEFIPAKHIFFVVDACYSGMNVLRSAPNSYSADMIVRPAWQILTAGRSDEQVADGGGPDGQNSVFTGYFLEGLRGKAADEGGVISASSVMHYVYRNVSNDTRGAQTPAYGWLRGDGDFIFQTPEVETLPLDLLRRVNAGPRPERLRAVGELTDRLQHGGPEAVQVIQALEQIAASNTDDLVRFTAQHALDKIRQRGSGDSQPGSRPVLPTRQTGPLPELPAERAAPLPEDPTQAQTHAPELPKERTQPRRPPTTKTRAALADTSAMSLPTVQDHQRTPRRWPWIVGLGLLFVALFVLTGVAMAQGLIHLDGLHLSLGPNDSAGEAMAAQVDAEEMHIQLEAGEAIIADKQAQATATAYAVAGLEAPVDIPAAQPTVAAPVRLLPPASVGTLLYTDDFTQDAGWLVTAAEGAAIGVEAGQLRFALSTPYGMRYAIPPLAQVPGVDDFVLDVEASILTPGTDGMLVVLFRAQDTSGAADMQLDDYYVFGVRYTGEVFLYLQQDGAPQAIVPLQTLPQGPLTPGEPVHLRVMAEGAALTFYVDGVEVIHAQDASLPQGYIALGALTRTVVPVDVVFDNLTIATLTS